MTFQPGNKLAKGGRRDKPFADALRMEIADAGNERPKLRAIARKLLDEAESGNMQAINCIADRLDGKPMQETEITTRRVVASELSDDELAGIIRAGSGNGVDRSPVDPSQLN